MNLKTLLSFLFAATLFFTQCSEKETTSPDIKGTWKLLSSVHIKKDNTVIHNDVPGTTMIKIINDTHFAFFQHTTNRSDSVQVFGAGGRSI